MFLLPLALAAEPAPVQWIADEATWRVRIGEGPIEIQAEYRLRAVGGGAEERILVGPELLVLDAEGHVLATREGLLAQMGPRLSVRGLLAPSAPGSASLPVLPAARQRVIVDAPGLDVTVAGSTGGWLADAARLDLTWRPRVEVEPSVPEALVLAEVATSAWGDAGALASRSVVRWRVRRGERSRFSVDVGALAEVEVSGANIARWERSGSTVEIETLSPVRGAFSVNIAGRSPLSPGVESDLPVLRPAEVSRVDRWWTLARSDEGELIPVSGPETVSAKALPPWARGLAEAVPLAYWHGEAAVRVLPAAYEPLAGPDTVVERAEFVLASSEEGRTLLRSTLKVRNERRQYLHLRPAPGYRLLAVRVSGTPVTVLSDGRDGFHIPLEKSIETVRGLLTFPVELTWLGEGEAWERRGLRTLTLPAVDAPIQSASWEVHLPRSATPIGATTAPVTLSVARRDSAGEAMNLAVRAYKENMFVEAQGWLDAAKSAAPEDEDVNRLQDNLDVLLKPQASEGEDTATRRVRELAHAKTGSMQAQQEVVEEKAEEALRAGDYDRAEALLQTATTLATELGRTTQHENAEQKDKLDAASRSLSVLRKNKAEKKQAEATGSQDLPDLMLEVDSGSFAPVTVPGAAAPSFGWGSGRGAGGGGSLGGMPAGRTAAPPPPPPAAPAAEPEPPADDRRPLAATATPLTVAMPLGGPAVAHSSALLPADAFPTFTLRYRTKLGVQR